MRNTTAGQDSSLAALDKKEVVRISVEDESSTMQPYTLIGGAARDWLNTWQVQRGVDSPAATWQASLHHGGIVARYAANATASTNTLTAFGHGLANGDTVHVDGTSLPGGLTAQTLYFVVGVSGDDYQLSATRGGSAVSITSDGSCSVVHVRTLGPTSASSNEIDAGRDVLIEVAVADQDTADEDIASGEWEEILSGRIDGANWPEDVTIRGRDGFGRLLDEWVETPTTYGTGGVAQETVMQSIVTDHLSTALTLDVPTSPGFTVVEYTQRLQSVAAALIEHSNLIGWDIREVWDDGSGAFVTRYSEPDRSKTTPDHTIDSDDYFVVSDIAKDTSGVRNVGIIEWKTGSFVTVEDTASIAEFGRRPIFLDSTAHPQITTSGLATTLITAVVTDLGQPLVQMVIEGPLFWPAELGDLIRFSANTTHLEEDTDLALVGITHAGGPGGNTTTFQLRGKPTGGSLRWHRYTRPTKRTQEARDTIPDLRFPYVQIQGLSRDQATDQVLVDLYGSDQVAEVYVTWTIGDGTSEPSDPTSGDDALGAASGTLDTGATAEAGQIVRVKARGEDGAGTLAPTEFIASARLEVAGVPDGSVDNDSFAASLQIAVDKIVSQAAGFSTDLRVKPHDTDEDLLQWASATLWFADGTSEAIAADANYAVNNNQSSAGTWYLYWDGSATAIADTQTFTTAIASDPGNILLATLNRSGGADPWTVIPAVGVLGVVGAPIQTEHLQAGSVVTDTLGANSVVASKIDSISLSTLQAAVGTLSSLNDDAGIIVSGTLQNAAGTRFIDLGASGTDPFIHAEDGSATTTLEVLADGTATFGGDLSAATGTFAGSLSAASGTFEGTVSASGVIATGDFTASLANFTGQILVGDSGVSPLTRIGEAQITFRDSDDSTLRFQLSALTSTEAKVVALDGRDLVLTGDDGVVVSASGEKLAFYGGTPAAKPTVTGSRGGNAALADLLTELETLGLITDSST